MTIFNDVAPEGNPLETLVGDGKKYRDPEQLAKAYLHLNEFAENLKAEQAALRADLDSRLTVEAAVAKLTEQRQVTTPNAFAVNETTPPAPQPATQPTLTDEDLAARVRQIASQDRQNEQVATNLQSVADKLVEVYGSEDNANKIVVAKARELGVSVDFLQDVAAKSPKAFFAQLGVVMATPTPQAPRGTVNPLALHNQSPQVKEGSYAWYETIRRENPSKYFTPAIQNQLHKDAARLGDEFWTGSPSATRL